MPICRLLSALVVLLGAGNAFGQANDSDLTVTYTPAGQNLIGIDDCTAQLDTAYTIVGSLDPSNLVAEGYTLRLHYSKTSNPCTNEQFQGECILEIPDTDCGCLAESEGGQELRREVTLAQIMSDACVPGDSRSRIIRFYLSFIPAADDSSNSSARSDVPAVITFDLARPSQPANAPTVTSAEASLVVHFEELGDSDIASYEVCAREQKADEAVATADAGAADEIETNETLKNGYSCEQVGVGSTTHRFSKGLNLVNEKRYLVVYAGIDTAGNRGHNSPAAEGVPHSVQDFAEYYSGTFGGREPGGCQSAPTGELPPISLLFLLVLVGARLRPRRTE